MQSIPRFNVHFLIVHRFPSHWPTMNTENRRYGRDRPIITSAWGRSFSQRFSTTETTTKGLLKSQVVNHFSNPSTRTIIPSIRSLLLAVARNVQPKCSCLHDLGRMFTLSLRGIRRTASTNGRVEALMNGQLKRLFVHSEGTCVTGGQGRIRKSERLCAVTFHE